MIFGWEGFWFSHPDDWAPATLSGTRKEGYAGLASPGRIACQVRWKFSPEAGDLEKRLDTYFARLRKDAIKAKTKFDSGQEASGRGLRYFYSAGTNGKGSIFYDEATQRVFFVELFSPKNDRLGTPLKEVLDSFGTGRERWAVFGMDVTLPGPLKLEKKVFLSGKSALMLGGRGTSVELQRWAFGRQLMDRHGLEPWTRAALSMKSATAEVGDGRISLTRPSAVMPTHALAAFQAETNQLVTIKVRSRQAKWRPQWDWLT